MEPLKIAICDDENIEYQLLKRMIENSEIFFSYDYFKSAEELLEDFQVGKYDLIFMDIYMPTTDGITCVEKIRQIDSYVPIAFSTSSTTHSLDSYRLHAQRYLVKPLKKEEVVEICEYAIAQRDNRPSLIVKNASEIRKIPYDHILYVEQQGHNLTFHLPDGKTFQKSGKLDDLEPDLSLQSFLRTHKSYLVNLNHVKAFDRELSTFTVNDGTQIHISRNHLANAARLYQEKVDLSI